jgi:hypothetical protein
MDTLDGQTRTQIYPALTDTQHASNITDVRSCQGTDCDLAHHFVKLKYQSRIRTAKISTGARNKKFNIHRIEDQTIKDEYREILVQQLGNHSPQSSNDTELKWKATEQSIHTAAEKVLGTTQQKKSLTDSLTALDIRNEAKKKICRYKERSENYMSQKEKGI